MSRIRKFQEKLKQRTRYQLLKSLFSSFSVTVIALVAVIVVIPRSPKVSFENIKAFSDEIVYQVKITDEDSVVKNEDLTIILENQFEKRVNTLRLGDNLGSFTNLEKATEYVIKVVYDKGFGEEVLSKVRVYTKDDFVAGISNYQMTEFDYYSTAAVTIKYGDTSPYTDFKLRYEFYYGENLASSNNIFLNEMQTEVEIPYVYYYFETCVLTLSAVYEGQEVIVDSVNLVLPYVLQASLYLAYHDDVSASFYIYLDSYLKEEVDYWLEVYMNDYLFRTIKVSKSNDDFHSELFVVDGLKPNQAYSFVLNASYQDPLTLNKKSAVLAIEEIVTLKSFDYEIRIVEELDILYVDIRLDGLVLDLAFYKIFNIEDGHYYYLYGEEFNLIEEEGYYVISFQVEKPNQQEYTIEIGLKDSRNMNAIKILSKIEK